MQKLFLLFVWLLAVTSGMADSLESGFGDPPTETRPWCYWYWISDNISKEGITKDLEAMASVGIGEALIGNVFQDAVPAGNVKVLSEEWWGMVEHAIREGGRVGVNIGLFNSPGWSQSGGPWVKSEQAMRYLVSSETRITGPKKFKQKLVQPAEQFQDVAVLAFPAPAEDGDSLAQRLPRVQCVPESAGVENLADGDLETDFLFPDLGGGRNSVFSIEIEVAQPFTARSLSLYPSQNGFDAKVVLEVAVDDGGWRKVREFSFHRRFNMQPALGPMPCGPVTIAFAPVTVRKFRLLFSEINSKGKPAAEGKPAALAEVHLSSAARIESFVEKQLGKLSPANQPAWDAYMWPDSVEPDSAKLAFAPDAVVDLSSMLAADGTLDWDVPSGEWIVLRVGMAPTGVMNTPASPEGRGLEVDKMNSGHVKAHFDAFMGELLRRMPASDRKALTRVIADSYEVGSQNWTDDFCAVFTDRYGYDPKLWLPVLTGRIVGSADQSDRFLWDLRRLIADRMAIEYVGGLRDAAHEHGLGLWLENYGHWGFSSEFLKYGGGSDRIGGEFWVKKSPGLIECRAASSCANTYGKQIVSAEAFTGGPAFQNAPADLKARGDWAFCQGINHFVLHVYIHQPWEDRKPGISAWFGTEFNRHNTWFSQGRVWIDYLRRSCWLLQQGHRVADVAYFIGEDAPKMTGVQNPPLPAGYDFDYINAEIIENRLAVRDGLLVVQNDDGETEGVAYRVLVLPDQSTMRPELLRKIGDLVKDGATIVGPPPVRSPSLDNYPKCDAEIKRLADELWGGSGGQTGEGMCERSFGKGRVVRSWSLPDVFAKDGAAPDVEFMNGSDNAKFIFTHRSSSEAEIYFISNQTAQNQEVDCVFRAAGRQPELWDAVTGEIHQMTDWRVQDGRTYIPLKFEPAESYFVVFRGKEVRGKGQEEEGEGGKRQGARGNFANLEEVCKIDGEWDVSFPSGWGAPESIKLPQLMSLSEHADAGVKYFSGTATYRKTFSLPAVNGKQWTVDSKKDRVFMDLGEVKSLARVKLNGCDLGGVWCAPWRVALPKGLLKEQGNELEIEVVNVWNNRLNAGSELADAQHQPWTVKKLSSSPGPLLKAGLLGPVRVMKKG